ncbi:MAG: pyridoxamine 5'-phosphate oxidase family protein [Clostridiales bacterium]|nr:pyridoxamine 5'-phosphate oxidase family protein [Clostridiales bacterium]
MTEKMRREKQALEKAEIDRILERNTSGVLALMDKDGYPYAVPLSYVYENGKIYFHSAKTGHKIDAVRFCDKASFCVIDKDDVQPEKYTTFYKSVIAFGKAEIVQSEEEALYAMKALGEKYYPDHDEALNAELERFKSAFAVIKFSIEHITGKQARELMKQ